MKLEGAVVVVVGVANGGVGTAICEQMLQKGAKVVCGDVQENEGNEQIDRIKQKFGADDIVFVKCNVQNDSDVAALFQIAITKYGKVDVLCNTAGIIHEFEWQQCVDVNLGGTIRLTMEALKHMSKANGGNGGVIIHASSVGGLYPIDWGPVYAATKWAIIGYVLSWAEAENVKTTGVRFNCVCPVSIDTKFLGQVQADTVYRGQSKMEGIKKEIKLKPSAVAEEFVRIAGDECINGVALEMLTSGTKPHDFGPLPQWDFADKYKD